MSTVKFFAKSFRLIVEVVNWIAIAAFLVAIFVYLFNRDDLVRSFGLNGFYSDGAVLGYLFIVFIGYILIVGTLCVFLEIYSLLERIAENGGTSEARSNVSESRGEPKI